MPDPVGDLVPSDYDRDHIGQIVRGHGSWFGAQLIRLINGADAVQVETLRDAYPEHVRALEEWRSGIRPGLDDLFADGASAPGEKAPASGVYRPATGGTEVALSRDDRFPPLDRAKGGWVLVRATETDAPAPDPDPA